MSMGNEMVKIPDLADRLTQASLKQYSKLGKKGKPTTRDKKAEWTVLACILLLNLDTEDIKVISLGTGLKCLPFCKLSKSGSLVHDTHAEVVARRGFMKYAMEQAERIEQGLDATFCYADDGRLKPRPNLSFHMYLSQSPCGDASMSVLAAIQPVESREAFECGSKRKAADADRGVPTPSCLLDHMYAKRFKPADHLDYTLRRGRYGFDTLGVLRTKPGRLDSEPSLCMSCSDKIARWNVLGLQSAMLAHAFHPVYLDTIVLGDMFDKVSLEQALFGRLESLKDLPAPYSLHRPHILESTMPFEASKSYLEATGQYTAVTPCGVAISWIPGMSKAEVIVKGKKEGVRKDAPDTPTTRPTICKRALFETFCRVFKYKGHASQTYRDMKKQATTYCQAKKCLLDQCFGAWVQTPEEYEAFTIE